MNKDKATNNGKSKINSTEWFVPHYTPIFSQQTILSKHILSMTPAENQCAERFVFMEEVNTQNLGTFELGTPERLKIPMFRKIGFQQQDR